MRRNRVHLKKLANSPERKFWKSRKIVAGKMKRMRKVVIKKCILAVANKLEHQEELRIMYCITTKFRKGKITKML